MGRAADFSLSSTGRVRWTHLISGHAFGWGQEVVVDTQQNTWVADSARSPLPHAGQAPIEHLVVEAARQDPAQEGEGPGVDGGGLT